MVGVLGGVLSLYLLGFIIMMWRDVHGFFDAVQAMCASFSIVLIGLLMWRGIYA